MSHYEERQNYALKDDQSPVTEADIAVLSQLSAFPPEIPVIAEEAASGGTCPSIGSRVFLVDPLGGTKEFISGNDEFTVNIALVGNGQPKFGVVHAPALK